MGTGPAVQQGQGTAAYPPSGPCTTSRHSLLEHRGGKRANQQAKRGVAITFCKGEMEVGGMSAGATEPARVRARRSTAPPTGREAKCHAGSSSKGKEPSQRNLLIQGGSASWPGGLEAHARLRRKAVRTPVHKQRAPVLSGHDRTPLPAGTAVRRGPHGSALGPAPQRKGVLHSGARHSAATQQPGKGLRLIVHSMHCRGRAQCQVGAAEPQRLAVLIGYRGQQGQHRLTWEISSVWLSRRAMEGEPKYTPDAGSE